MNLAHPTRTRAPLGTEIKIKLNVSVRFLVDIGVSERVRLGSPYGRKSSGTYLDRHWVHCSRKAKPKPRWLRLFHGRSKVFAGPPPAWRWKLSRPGMPACTQHALPQHSTQPWPCNCTSVSAFCSSGAGDRASRRPVVRRQRAVEKSVRPPLIRHAVLRSVRMPFLCDFVVLGVAQHQQPSHRWSVTWSCGEWRRAGNVEGPAPPRMPMPAGEPTCLPPLPDPTQI